MSLLVSTLFESPDVANPQRIVVPLPAVDRRATQIAVISHELRNSLSVVRNAARLLRQPIGNDGVERARILIERHVEQMNRHIEDLVDTAPLSRRKDVLRLTHVDLRKTLQNSIDAVASECSRRGHRLSVNLPDCALWVHVDSARLEQAFSNLLINAAKYTPDGGEIEITMERFAKHISIRIRDSGIGIAPALLSRIFEIFMQVDANVPCADGGRGIGLAVVRDLIEKHGGTVTAASAGLDQGSEFTILLPTRWSDDGG